MKKPNFRAWSKKHNRYLKITGIRYDGEKFEGVFVVFGTIAGIPNVIFLEPDNVILEQDTGLKDKNSKKICEGDIVEQSLVDDPFNKSYPLYIVCWSQKFLGWALKDADGDEGNDTDLHFFIDNQEKIEVIGNIHENHELLEEEK